MAMNPLEQKGIPVDDQLRSWSEINVEPFDARAVEPYTRTRVILMNGIEVESINFSHQFARMTDNPEIKTKLATMRRLDQQQQKVVNGLNPGDQTPLETTIGYEQVAVDLTAWLARHEPDPMLKQALDFALQEACDLLRRYEGVEPEEILPPELPDTPVTFEPNKDYVRRILADQVDLRTDGFAYVPVDQLPDDHRYFRHQEILTADGPAPSEQVIAENLERQGREYRDETEGDNPVVDLRPPVNSR